MFWKSPSQDSDGCATSTTETGEKRHSRDYAPKTHACLPMDSKRSEDSKGTWGRAWVTEKAVSAPHEGSTAKAQPRKPSVPQGLGLRRGCQEFKIKEAGEVNSSPH